MHFHGTCDEGNYAYKLNLLGRNGLGLANQEDNIMAKLVTISIRSVTMHGSDTWCMRWNRFLADSLAVPDLLGGFLKFSLLR